MTNTKVYVPSTVSQMFLLNAVKVTQNAQWSIRWNEHPGYHAVTVTEPETLSEIIDSLTDHKIETYLELPSDSKEEFDLLSTDKKANVSYWDKLDDISTKYVDEILNNSFDKNGNKPAFTSDERLYFAKQILETAISLISQRSFPFVDCSF